MSGSFGPQDSSGAGASEVRIWLEPADSGTSILVSTDHNGEQAFEAFWQPNDTADGSTGWEGEGWS